MGKGGGRTNENIVWSHVLLSLLSNVIYYWLFIHSFSRESGSSKKERDVGERTHKRSTHRARSYNDLTHAYTLKKKRNNNNNNDKIHEEKECKETLTGENVACYESENTNEDENNISINKKARGKIKTEKKKRHANLLN